MKTRLTGCIIGFCLLLAGTGCEPEPEYRLKVLNEVYNFGVVEEGVEINFSYILKNTGGNLIHIDHVSPSCGCTVAGDWDKEIRPGKIGRIPVTFRTHGYKGEVSRYLTVITDIPDQDPIQLTVKGTVQNSIDIHPGVRHLGEVREDSGPLYGNFEITNNTESPLEILDVITPDDHITCILQETEAGKKFLLQFTVFPPFENDGVVDKKLIIKTNYKEHPELEAPISYFVMPPVHVYPQKIMIADHNPQGDPIVWYINIRSNISESIKLRDLRLEGTDLISYELMEQEAGVNYQIRVSIPADFTFPEESVQLSFRVDNDPRGKLYEIPVEVYVIPES